MKYGQYIFRGAIIITIINYIIAIKSQRDLVFDDTLIYAISGNIAFILMLLTNKINIEIFSLKENHFDDFQLKAKTHKVLAFIMFILFLTGVNLCLYPFFTRELTQLLGKYLFSFSIFIATFLYFADKVKIFIRIFRK